MLLFCGCRLTAAAARAKSTDVVVVVVVVVLVVVLSAALLPRMASGERKRSPHRRELLFSLFVFVLCTIYY